MTEASLNIDTALGSFVFIAECDYKTDVVSLDLRAFEPRLSLPPGMSVLGCHAVILRVTTQIDIAVLRWSCQSPNYVTGSPCSGQYLEAQEWQADDRLVVAGTEDEEALENRLGFLRLDPNESLAHYSPQKLSVRIPCIPASTTFTLHFVIAENTTPEPIDASAWFAVDIPHKHLVAPNAA